MMNRKRYSNDLKHSRRSGMFFFCRPWKTSWNKWCNV